MKSVCASGRLPHFCWLARDALAEQAAAGHREQAVGGLPAGALVVLERVGEVGQPLAAARRWWWRGRARARPTVSSEPTNSRAGAPTTQSMPRMIAISTSAVPRSPCTTTSAITSAGDRHHRDQRVLPVAEQPLLAGVEVRAPQDDRELGELGGLHGERTEREPVAVAVDLEAERRAGEVDQHGRRRRSAGQASSRSSRCGSREATNAIGSAEQHPGQLLEEDVVAVAVDLEGVDARGAEHHHQPDGEQQRRGAEQQVVRRQRPVEQLARPDCRAPATGPDRRRATPAAAPRSWWSRSALLACRGWASDRAVRLSGRGGGGPTRRRHPRERRSSRTCPWTRIPGRAARCRPAGRALRPPRRRGP